MGMYKIGRRQGPPSTRIPRRPCPPISRVLPNGHSKKQMHENQHKQKGMLSIMCVLGVQLAFLNIEGFCLFAAGKCSFVVIVAVVVYCISLLLLLSLLALLVSFCFDWLPLSLSFVCAAAIVRNDGIPVGDGSNGPERSRGQTQARDTPMMLATSTVAFSRVESNRIESNKSNRIE